MEKGGDRDERGEKGESWRRGVERDVHVHMFQVLFLHQAV